MFLLDIFSLVLVREADLIIDTKLAMALFYKSNAFCGKSCFE